MCNPHFFQKCCYFHWNQNKVSKNDNTFERNEYCATVFLKWTDFSERSGQFLKHIKSINLLHTLGFSDKLKIEQIILKEFKIGQIFHCEHFRSSKTERAQKVIVVQLAPYSRSLCRARQLRYIGKICLLTMVLYALKSKIKLSKETSGNIVLFWQPVWTYLYQFQSIQSNPNLSKLICANQNLSEPIWIYPNPSEIIQTYLNLSKPILTYQNLSKNFV